MERDRVADCLLVRRPLDAGRLLEAVSDATAGANVLFVGTTRRVTDGVATSRLVYDAHEPLALCQLERLRSAAIRTFGLARCVVHHRLGPVAVGEASVVIATSAPHRREAFSAAEWLMERIKGAVPIWKCEEHPDGSRHWVHPDAPPQPVPPCDDFPEARGTP